MCSLDDVVFSDREDENDNDEEIEKEEKEEKEEEYEELGMLVIENHSNKKESNEKFKQIMEYCEKTKSTFVDKEFPHEPKSYMTLKRIRTSYGKYESWKTWFYPKIWRRLAVPFADVSSSLSVYDPLTFTAYEVFQRKVGDCSLVAALSAISTKPEVIMNIFDSLQLSKYGVYKVKLFVDGQWKTIIIDDYFPYTTDDMRIGATSGKQIWAALIEKALAKERGNYKGITGFQNQSAFSALTGSPVLSILTTRILKELRKHWKILMDYKKNQYPMACETTIQRRNGILSKHVYTIMDIVEREGHKLLLLRNPSGGSVWTGSWSKEWEWWPENMKDLLEGMIRGSFWISWDDFLNVFCSIYVLKKKDKMSIKKYTDNNSTFIAVVAWNFAYDQFLHVHLRYSITDEQLVSRSLEDNQTVDVIPPRGVQILVVIEQYAMPEIVDFPIDIDYKLSKEVDSTINGIKRGCHLPEISSSRFLEQVHREERISVADCFLDLPSNYCQN